jgi:hypothetical protein
MKHQMRLKKELFENPECYLYLAPAEGEETVV